nr:DUF4853 domain-containing protein [Schaalia odontolytica]
MNSEQKELLARASRMESIEAFQRDVEPAIIAARDQLMTRENYRGYFRNDMIARNNVGDHVLYAFISRSYDFDEHDPVRVREVFDAVLAPLGFECSEKADVLQDGTTDTVLIWGSERFGATVHVMVSESWLTSMNYYTDHLRSDGSVTDPKTLMELPGRIPEWFADVAAGTQS